MQQWNPEVAVFPNQIAQLPQPRLRTDSEDVVLLFAALNRQPDYAPLLPALNQIFQQYPQVRVEVIWDQGFFAALQTDRKTFTPFCAYEEYQRILSRCDINLAPLLPTPFNSMKSDLKFIESVAHGVVTLASPTAYAESLIDGKTGLLFRTPQEFYNRLEQLVLDQDLRWAIAQQGYAYVRDERMLAYHFRQRYVWYQSLWERRAELTASLRQRVPALVAE